MRFSNACDIVVHVLTSEYPPTQGGLELWTRGLCEQLSSIGVKVWIYVCGTPAPTEEHDTTRPQIVNIADERAHWDAALNSTGWSAERIAREVSRLDFNILRNELGMRVAECPALKHIIVSNFALSVGYMGTLIAGDLRLPHVALVVGTDFSRGSTNVHERAILGQVCRGATRVVCKSTEQSSSLARMFDIPLPTVIPTGVDSDTAPIGPQSASADGIRLFSDVGCSFHKGTEILLDSFLCLWRDGLPVTLTLCGPIHRAQEAFWNERLAQTTLQASSAFEFLGYISQSAVREELRKCSIYCSPTLGEGSSAARIAALCAGKPIVTTRCGEFLFDVEQPLTHVFLCDRCNYGDFRYQLWNAVEAHRAGLLVIDSAAVERARLQFSSKRIRERWSEFFMGLKDAYQT